MGSANCKAKNSITNEDGTTGSYQVTSEENMSEYTDAVAVCHTADIENNEMKVLDFNDTKILLIKQNGTLSALGNKCTHYGAPLHTGTLGNGRVRCPWHGACFDAKTGDIEDFPGLDSLPCYKVEVAKDGQVKVRAKRKDLEKAKRLKDMVKRDENDERTFIVVGGGPAGAVCVETLRQEGFKGRIVFICRENDLPYDRIKINKTMDTPVEKLQYRDAKFYADYDIEVMLGVEAKKLDATNKTVHCSNGYDIKFDKIFIATGVQAIKPPIKGADLKNVFTIRDHADVKTIQALVNPEAHVVCLGSSFIAMESAAYMANKVKSVTVVARENVPFKASFGEVIGQRVIKLFTDNGVNMLTESGIVEIFGNADGQVTEVQLKDDSKIPCDILIMGTGGRYYTDFMKYSGVAINENGSIDTDMHLRTNIPDIFVGGDIANAPVFSIANQRASIGHIQLAQYHGRIAAINMCGARVKELRAVPFFFSMIFGKGIRYSGYGKFSTTFIEGDLENFKFVVYFMDEANNVVAVASCGRDPIVAQFAELQYQGKRLNRSDIEGGATLTAWTEMLKE